jgi:hypothetical protein
MKRALGEDGNITGVGYSTPIPIAREREREAVSECKEKGA